MTVVQLDRATGEVFDLPQNDLRRENIELRQQVERLKESLVGQAESLRVLRGKNQALLRERNESRAMDPLKSSCDRIFEKWNALVAPRAKEFGEKRYAPVRARLNNGYTVEDGLRAIDGALNMPASIKGSQRDAMRELEFIFRNEKNLDMFLGWADPPTDEVASSPAGPGGPGKGGRAEVLRYGPHVPGPLDRAVIAIREEWGYESVTTVLDDDYRTVACLCPCPIRYRLGEAPMVIKPGKGPAGPDRSMPTFFCAHGCLPDDLFSAVSDLERRSELRYEQAVSRACAAGQRVGG